MNFQALISPYSAWHDGAKLEAWRETVPLYKRPIFAEIWQDLASLPQVLSLTGPRRVGKSTLLKQMIRELLANNVPPTNIIYYSLDDPARFRRESSGESAIECLMQHMRELGIDGPTYLFLDEIQTLDRWEQYLKKYYDLQYPVKIVISGSASSPIFKKSRESLLGRVKDYHILPFSFSEFLQFRLNKSSNVELMDEMARFATAGRAIRGMLTEHPDYLHTHVVDLPDPSGPLRHEAQEALNVYLLEGGFPEVWTLPTSEKKLEYLFDNQVKKVIHEDLVLAAEFRKPEQLKAFYISLLEQPGREVSLKSLANEAGINVQQIEKYVPLLEMTDLLAHASKFRNSPVRVRQGNRKFYLVDLALRNAVLRIGPTLLQDESMLGLYAENLVFNALRKWKGLLQIDYYHDGKKEVDFIAHTRSQTYLPIEVKYKKTIDSWDLRGLLGFKEKYQTAAPLLITKNFSDFGPIGTGTITQIPLLNFLLLME